MTKPAGRNSMWRYGFKNPSNFDDNGLNCGGFSLQWDTNKGKCGVCGDPFGGRQRHVFPGKQQIYISTIPMCRASQKCFPFQNKNNSGNM